MLKLLVIIVILIAWPTSLNILPNPLLSWWLIFAARVVLISSGHRVWWLFRRATRTTIAHLVNIILIQHHRWHIEWHLLLLLHLVADGGSCRIYVVNLLEYRLLRSILLLLAIVVHGVASFPAWNLLLQFPSIKTSFIEIVIKVFHATAASDFVAKSDGLSDLVTFLSFTVVFVVLFNLVDVVFTKDTIDYVDSLTIAHHARTLLSG